MSRRARPADHALPVGRHFRSRRAPSGPAAECAAALPVPGYRVARAEALLPAAQALAADGALPVQAVIPGTADRRCFWTASRLGWPDHPACERRSALKTRVLIQSSGAGQLKRAFRIGLAVCAARQSADLQVAGANLAAARCADCAPRRASDAHPARASLDLASNPRDAGKKQAPTVDVRDQRPDPFGNAGGRSAICPKIVAVNRARPCRTRQAAIHVAPARKEPPLSRCGKGRSLWSRPSACQPVPRHQHVSYMVTLVLKYARRRHEIIQPSARGGRRDLHISGPKMSGVAA